jgi:hypothetical protein
MTVENVIIISRETGEIRQVKPEDLTSIESIKKIINHCWKKLGEGAKYIEIETKDYKEIFLNKKSAFAFLEGRKHNKMKYELSNDWGYRALVNITVNRDGIITGLYPVRVLDLGEPNNYEAANVYNLIGQKKNTFGTYDWCQRRLAGECQGNCGCTYCGCSIYLKEIK